MNYTDEKNILILISLLKAHNIKKIIASPGATNISFVASVQNDDFFEIYSCVDERAACYLACGLAEESGEPVVITCTGATASRNYFSGLTEAYYRKLPIIAVTFTQHMGRIGQNIAQVIDRTNISNDIAKVSVQVPSIGIEEDKWACNLSINKALLESRRHGGGPVHINIATTYSNKYTITELPNERVINRYFIEDEFPKIDCKSVAIFVGAHSKWNEDLTSSVEQFCEKYNAVVLCDHTSNYHGKYKIMPNIVCDQQQYMSYLNDIELLIDIGNVSGAYVNFKPRKVWRVNIDGELRDTYKKLTKVFEMNELAFFDKYNKMNSEKKSGSKYFNEWKTELEKISNKVEDNKIPFSNIWIAKNIINILPENSIFHLGILNTLRSWNLFSTEKKLFGYCNTGGFGIDGLVSTLVGASYSNKDKNVYGFIGDLAFFYDMNSLGIRDIKNNIRLLVINNGCGTEFHNYTHRSSNTLVDIGKFIAADGHNGFKSKSLLKHYSEDLGFKYLSAETKDEFIEKVSEFVSDSDKPIIYEIFTNSNDESDALKYMLNLEKNATGIIKEKAKEVLSDKQKSFIKNLIGR